MTKVPFQFFQRNGYAGGVSLMHARKRSFGGVFFPPPRPLHHHHTIHVLRFRLHSDIVACYVGTFSSSVPRDTFSLHKCMSIIVRKKYLKKKKKRKEKEEASSRNSAMSYYYHPTLMAGFWLVVRPRSNFGSFRTPLEINNHLHWDSTSRMSC